MIRLDLALKNFSAAIQFDISAGIIPQYTSHIHIFCVKLHPFYIFNSGTRSMKEFKDFMKLCLLTFFVVSRDFMSTMKASCWHCFKPWFVWLEQFYHSSYSRRQMLFQNLRIKFVDTAQLWLYFDNTSSQITSNTVNQSEKCWHLKSVQRINEDTIQRHKIMYN